jgi:hypothetical protein
VRIDRRYLEALALALACAWPRASWAGGPDVELGPDVGVVSRPAEGGRGATYGTAVAYGAHVQIPAVRALRVTLYYSRSSQSVEVDRARYGAPVTPQGRLESYVLGARIQPTFHVSERLRLWANLCVAWGIMTAPVLHVSAASPFDIGQHSDAFVEFPFGIGGEFDFWRNVAGVTLDLAAGPVSAGFDPTRRFQTLNASGKLVEVPSLPPFGSIGIATLGLSLHI